MDSTNTINSWKDFINSKLLKENFLNFNTENNNESLPIINDDSLALFNDLLSGESLLLAELTDTSHLNKSIDEFISNHPNKKIIFTNLSESIQSPIIKDIVNKNNQSISDTSYSIAYVTFGIINYVIDNKKYQAPLVFIPIKISSSSNDEHYKISRLNKEIYLNYPLIDKIKKTKKIDLSYPVNQAFTLSEYLYYISIKVKPINWFVSNQCFLSCFDFSFFYDLNCIDEYKEEISKNQLVKKISYFNSEFFAFNNHNQLPLDNKYLSLLNMESEEYQLLKSIARRENLLIRCDHQANKYHFVVNVILTYLLNNKKVLLTYSNDVEKIELLKEIKKNSLDKFILDLDLDGLNKSDLLSSLASYDKFVIPYNSLHTITIDEDVTQYYDLKNRFQSLINSLRTTRNPLKTSINKIINNYYALSDYPLIDVSIKETKKIDLELLQQYLQNIKDFANTIEALECPINEHPFYGFNKKKMVQDDYIPLKNHVISLSELIKDGQSIYEHGVSKYHLPYAANLKEMKAILNILTFIDYYKDKNTDWILNDHIDNTYDQLRNIYHKISQIENKIIEACEPYGKKAKEIPFSLLDKMRIEKKQKRIAKKIRRKYLSKKIPLSEVSYLSNKLYALYKAKNDFENQKNEYGKSYIDYIDSHSFEEFRDIINNINIYRYNLNYIKNKNDFDVIYQIKDTKIESSKHRQVMQIVFNEILDSTKIVQDYFNKKVVDFDTMDLNCCFEKVEKMALNFSSINRYLDFLLLQNKLNNTANGLGDKLSEYGDYHNFENVFLKRFYYDLLSSCLNNKELFVNLNRTDIFELLDNFKDSDNKRKKLIEKIIYNNFNKNTATTLYDIKTSEGKQIKKLLEEQDFFINLDQICNYFSKSIHNFKPCVISSYKQVSKLLRSKEYTFDVAIVLSNRSMEIRDIIPTIAKSEQLIVFDQLPLNNDIRSSIIYNDNPSNLISACKNTFKEIKYTQRSHDVFSSMESNLYDLDFKDYLMKKLRDNGFEVGINRLVKEHIIDVLVKVKNSPSSVAIMIDHFPYYSPEEASEAFFYQEQFIKSIGYSPYRIFTSLYFIDEEKEFNSLVEYIVNQSKLIPQIDVKKTRIYLMDYLFPLYKDPRQTYFNLASISNLKDKVKEFIQLSAPISLEEIRVIFKENIEEQIRALVKDRIIEISDDFIYIPNERVRFRRVNRNEDFYRPLDLVSEKEIFNAIYEIIDYKLTLNKDTIIKMILLSLGYKKSNAAKYAFVESKINFLLEQKIIFIENNILYRNI